MFLSQEVFRAALEREQKRHVRFTTEYALVCIDITALVHHGNEHQNATMSIRKKIIHKAIDALTRAGRDIDIKGWYTRDTVLGIIFTEISPDSQSTLVSKIRNALHEVFTQRECTCITTTVYGPEDLAAFPVEATNGM